MRRYWKDSPPRRPSFDELRGHAPRRIVEECERATCAAMRGILREAPVSTWPLSIGRAVVHKGGPTHKAEIDAVVGRIRRELASEDPRPSISPKHARYARAGRPVGPRSRKVVDPCPACGHGMRTPGDVPGGAWRNTGPFQKVGWCARCATWRKAA